MSVKLESAMRSPESPVRLSPMEAYESRLKDVRAEIAELEVRDNRFVRVRTIIFVVAVGLGILCIGEPDLVSWWWMAVPVLGFLALLPFHQRCVGMLARSRSLQAFHESRIARLHRIFGNDVADGKEFLNENHPWAQDLDVFGPGSLFQMLNECRTQPGRKYLATWMTTVPDADTIRVRQARAQGLRDSLPLRESLACIPGSADWARAETLLRTWVREPAQPVSLTVLSWSVAIGAIAVPILALVALEVLALRWLVLLVLLQTPAVILTRKQILHTAKEMDDVDAALRQFSQVIELFEQHMADEPTIRDLQNRLHTETETASRAIRRLSKLTQWLNNSMRNQFFVPVAWACGLLVLLTHLLECWRRQFGVDVEDWLETVACLEATLCVAGYSFDHPEDVFPEILDQQTEFRATGLGHPLLKESVCIRNDIQLTAEKPLMLISGSNMSGKSTFLRSIGASLVLTYCGSVVRASQFRTYPFQLGTAMRVSDSLQEGRSLFFSVVQRLKAVVDLTLGERVVLFLLDEILHGTNSHDRRRGAEAVIRSLVERKSLGIVTTHDLALTRIADTMNGLAVNMHFEDTIVDGTMTFDYTLRDGVVERSNAIELMRMLGLNV